VRWLRHRAGETDVRLADARAATEAAAREIEVSRARAESVREHVNEPRRRIAEHNQFSDLIRATLTGNGGQR
jgi:hypothetical protein